MTPKTLPLNQLALARQAARTEPDDVIVERSIAEHGIFSPLFVTPVAEKLYEVIDGERRVCFARQLLDRGKLPAAFRFVPCQIIATSSEREKALWRVLCNLHRGLAGEELEALAKKAAITIPLAVASQNGTARSEANLIGDLLHGLSIRSKTIRSARRTMDALETARDYVAGALSHQEAMNRLRYTGGMD